MPVQWNLPTTGASWTVQDVERFNKAPFYLYKQMSEHLPYWSTWKGLFGKLPWSPNQGDVIVGVQNEYSPKGSQVMKPNYITSTPLKTVASYFQRTNTGRIYLHDFESPIFSFLPNFRDFVTGQLDWANKDLSRQIAMGYDDFCRWQAWQVAQHVFVCGASSPYVTGVPVGPPGEGVLADPKDAAFNLSIAASLGSSGFLDFRTIVGVRSYARDVVGMVPWDGVPGKPADNAIMGGRWLLIGEAALYEALSYDEHVLNTRMLTQDLQHKEWGGVISGNIEFRSERYPLRMAADGTFPEPEIEQTFPANATITSGNSSITNPGGATSKQTIPNPAYVNAPYGIAHFFGNNPFKTIDVGPPPAEFAAKKLDPVRLSKLSWNGEIRMTDNILVNYGGSGGLSLETMDTNKYGKFLQLISEVTLGFMPFNMRNYLPILYRRQIAPSLKSTI